MNSHSKIRSIIQSILYLLIFQILIQGGAIAQYDNYSFYRTGDAFLTQEAKPYWDLTHTSTTWTTGAIWYKQKIDLDNSHTFTFWVNFEEDLGDDKADGIAFVFHKATIDDDERFEGVWNVIGGPGCGMGFGCEECDNENPPGCFLQTGEHDAISPSFAIELDIFYNHPTLFYSNCNNWVGDMGTQGIDHIAFVEDGKQGEPLTNEQQTMFERILYDNNNAEDGIDHCIEITWNHQTKKCSIYVDGHFRTSIQYDIEQHLGSDMVWWGITAATGDCKSRHRIHFDDMVKTCEDKEICYGDKVELTTYPIIRGQGNPTFSWFPAIGLDDPTKQSPIARPATTTKYTVMMTTTDGTIVTDDVLVNVRGKPLMYYNKFFGRETEDPQRPRTYEMLMSLLKTPDCGYLFSCQSMSPDLNHDNKEYDNLAYLIKTDCDATTPEWSKMYIRENNIDGQHHSCANETCALFEKKQNTDIQTCGEPIEKDEFEWKGYLITGESKDPNEGEFMWDMYVMAINKDGNIIDKIVFPYGDVSVGNFILQNNDGSILTVGDDGDEILFSKLRYNNNQLSRDPSMMTNDYYIYSLQDHQLTGKVVKNCNDGSVILGDIDDDGQTPSNDIFVMKINNTNGGVMWAYRYDAGAQDVAYSMAEDDDYYFVLGTQPVTSGINDKAFILRINKDGTEPRGLLIYDNDNQKEVKGVSIITINNNLQVSVYGYRFINGQLQNPYVTYFKTDKGLTGIFDQITYDDPQRSENNGSNLVNLGFGGFAATFENYVPGDVHKDNNFITTNNEFYNCSNTDVLVSSTFTTTNVTVNNIVKTSSTAIRPTFETFNPESYIFDDCNPLPICYCEDEYINVFIEQKKEIEQGHENDCCYKLTFQSFSNACQFTKVKIKKGIGEFVEYPNFGLQPGETGVLEICYPKFWGNEPLYIEYYNGGNKICEAVKEIWGECDCDDYAYKNLIKLDAVPISYVDDDFWGYYLSLRNELPCTFNSFGIEMIMPTEVKNLLTDYEALNGWWKIGPTYITSGEYAGMWKVLWRNVSGSKYQNDGKDIIFGKFRFEQNPLETLREIILKIRHDVNLLCSNEWKFDLSIKNTCCDKYEYWIYDEQRQIEFDLRSSITPDQNDPCCYNLEFFIVRPQSIDLEKTFCGLKLVRISYSNDKKQKFYKADNYNQNNDWFYTVDVSNGLENYIHFCLEDAENINPLEFRIDFVNGVDQVLCSKTYSKDNMNECAEECCDDLTIQCTTSDQVLYDFNLNCTECLCDVYKIELWGLETQALLTQIGGRSQIFPYNLIKLDLSGGIQFDDVNLSGESTNGGVKFKLYDELGIKICEKDYLKTNCTFVPIINGNASSMNNRSFNVDDKTYFDAFPNPSSETITIKYSVIEYSQINIELYNSIGKKISNIYHGLNQPGSKSFEFDSRNIPQGLYFIICNMNGFKYVKSVSIVR